MQGNKGVLNEWAYEGSRKPRTWLVVSDVSHTLQCVSHKLCEIKAEVIQFGWHRRIKNTSCPIIYGIGFLFLKDDLMKTKRWRKFF